MDNYVINRFKYSITQTCLSRNFEAKTPEFRETRIMFADNRLMLADNRLMLMNKDSDAVVIYPYGNFSLILCKC